MTVGRVLVVGQGEIGKPITALLSRAYNVSTKDIESLDLAEPLDVMHICYPYQVGDFVSTTVDYIHQYAPALTIIHSTVVPGTTRAVEDRSERPVTYSPVRGKHAMMESDLLSHTKYVAATQPETSESIIFISVFLLESDGF